MEKKKMNLATRYSPFGALPYEDLDIATNMEAKLYRNSPFLATFPNIDKNDTLLNRTLSSILGDGVVNGEVLLNDNGEYKQALNQLDETFNNPTLENLEPYKIDSPFLNKYELLIKKFKPQNAYINLLGPFSVSQKIFQSINKQSLLDKTYRKLIIQAIGVKALWAINKIKEYCPTTTPVILLEEPLFSLYGNLKRENEEISPELITSLFNKIIETIHSAGGIVGIHSHKKCHWTIPINAGVDIISFDAYNNPNNLTIISDEISEFIVKGGKINWGIIPIANEKFLKDLSIDTITNRMLATFDILISAGVSPKLVYRSALVSVQGDLAHLPLIFAEKAIILSTQLATKIPTA
jgi:hypothetical protein